MLKNYLKIAFRNISRHWLFSLINVVGLAIGISAAIVIYLIVSYESSYDKFHVDQERIFRITSEFREKESVFYNSGISVPLSGALKAEATGIENISALYQAGIGKASGVNTFKNPEHIIFSDGQYFKIFKYNWLAGSSVNALDKPNTVVLAESRARSYYPKVDIMQILGKQIIYDDTLSVTITGIVKDLQKPTDLVFKEFVSLKTIENNPILKKELAWDEWNNTNSASQLFVKVNSLESVAIVERQLLAIALKYQNKSDLAFGQTRQFNLQPLNDIHFNQNYGNFTNRLANRNILLGLSLVAVFLLVLGCINFINLSTAQAVTRIKEIGVRKTMGSSRTQLMVQFLCETLLVTAIAAILSLLITPYLLYVFAGFIPPGLVFDLTGQPDMLLFLGLLILLVGFFSGFYPALMLSKLQPTSILKGNALTSGTRAPLRRALTISQFIIAQVFIMATMMVGKQIHFLLNKDMGFKKDAIIIIRTPWKDPSEQKKLLFLDKLKGIAKIERASLGSFAPSARSRMSRRLEFNKGKNTIQTNVDFKYGDRSYLEVYQLKLLAGRNLLTDTAREFIINESYARTLGFKDPAQAIGHFIHDEQQTPIVGVIGDFNQHSLHLPVAPLILTARNTYSNTVHVALRSQDKSEAQWQHAISQAGQVWKEVYPGEEFKYEFVDESIAGFYKKELNMSKLLTWATGLAILISCLGLVGLAIFTISQRTKEIGVRKVLGASVQQIVALLSKDFIRLILLAFIAAVPVAWFAIHKWLENFAYKTEQSWTIFILSGSLMTGIALLAVCFQTIKAAIANPVKSLRTE